MLVCTECGCTCCELGKGWVAYTCLDPDDVDPPALAIYCPVCAAAEFGHRPDIAATYVRAWEPIHTEASDGVR